ncbi:MAG: alpha-amylase family glycosyl hydrolase [Gemmatimonadota bacterium]
MDWRARRTGRTQWGATRVALTLALSTVTGFGCRAEATPAGDAAADEPPTSAAVAPSEPEFWNSATVYFLLTDRFRNGDPSNDFALGRARDGAPLRSFLGGDFRGVLEKIEEGYFDALGVTALWMTPFVEQIHGSVDEGTGQSYGFHGYWARDWTAVEPALGSVEDLRALIDAAHRHGMRVLMDAVINHTGPVTPLDPQWPDEWVRTGPRCVYTNYVTTVECTLVDNLPDVRTDRDEPVELPPLLVAKWEQEGRLAEERAELDAFFQRTGYARAPRYYLIKWLTDWVRELGIDGYRVDTAKHFEERISAELAREAETALAEWRAAHPEAAGDDLPFFMVGEVYGYDVDGGAEYDFGDRRVDYFEFGYDALINFGFKRAATGPIDDLFSRYSRALSEGAVEGSAILNYVSSHDDGEPYDLERRDPLGAGTRLLLSPGGAQIYYGDEVARPLQVAGAQGDANLRSPMEWDAIDGGDVRTREILDHWQKLGRFRAAHPAVGSGLHRSHQTDPYIFSRTLERPQGADRVLVALAAAPGVKTIPVFGVFEDGTVLEDAYSGWTGPVRAGVVTVESAFGIVLLGEPR